MTENVPLGPIEIHNQVRIGTRPTSEEVTHSADRRAALHKPTWRHWKRRIFALIHRRAA